MMLTMPVDRSFHRQLILHKHLEIVPFVSLNQRARLLAVDKVHLPTEAVYDLLAKSLLTAKRTQTWSSHATMKCKVVGT